MSAMSNGSAVSLKRTPAGHAAPAAETRTVDRAEIEAVVQSVVATLRGDMTATELSLFAELEGLSRFIRHAKQEIAALRPDEIQDKHLPSATDELDAIVGSTAEATHTILDSVEKIEKACAALTGEAKDDIGNAVTAIYEACNFQDITGQRISKVVRTLKQIEAKVAGLVAAFGDEIDRVAAANPGLVESTGAKEPSDADKALLNGPQLPGAGNTQADIDALFGSD
jgi:chemotaxis protein CheZ